MATSVRLIRRYVWLVDTIRRAGQISLEEINRKWMEERTLRLEDEKEIPERTFHRHRHAIADIFGIDILCNRYNGNTYYIDDEEALDSPSFTSWLFNGLAIDNQLLCNREVSDRIVFEDTPGGMQHMPLILDAMNRNCKLKIDYNSISHGNYSQKIISPYFIKQRLRRWYLIALADKGEKPEVFALDRISSLAPVAENFEYDSTTDPAHYFDEVVGILLDDEYDCEEVVVRIYGRQARYVELLPIHQSQTIVGRGKDYIDFRYMVRPEWEFIHEILRLGFDAEVLSPQWVRDEIPWQAAEIIKRYRRDADTTSNIVPAQEIAPSSKAEPDAEADSKKSPETVAKPSILFLDFDGVLNTGAHSRKLQEENAATRDEYGRLFDPDAVSALTEIIERMNSPRIVITSSWRYKLSFAELKQMWIKRGMPGKIHGVLPCDSFCETRGEEIQDYLSGKERDTPYLVLDDEDSYSEAQKPHCLIVDSDTGLTKAAVESIFHLL